MKRNKNVILIYLTILFIFVFAFTAKNKTKNFSEYEKMIDTIEYQLKSPSLYTNNDLSLTKEVENDVTQTEEKVAYLTFDDGPSPRTEEILDILLEHDVKATFFISLPQEEEYSQYLKRASEEGHTIGVHSASHKYKEIYESEEAFINDFEICFNYIKDTTGLTPSVYRFAGGSVNAYNEDIINNIVIEMQRRGFAYFDWNVESNDSTKGISANSIYTNVIKGVKDKNTAVIVLHDSYTRKNTVTALEDIIIELKNQGFVFKELTSTTKPITFRLP